MQWLVSTYRVINFPRSYFNTSQFCHTFPEASELFVCYAKSLAFTYLESTLQHPRHKIRKAPSRPNFSYLSGNFSSCVACNVMVNITIIRQKPQNSQERQKRRYRFLCSVNSPKIRFIILFLTIHNYVAFFLKHLKNLFEILL